MKIRRRQKENYPELKEIDVAKIKIGESRPRKSIDMYELSCLAESIRLNGIIQPLTVREEKGEYALISGERRLKAAILSGLIMVPCIVTKTDKERAKVISIVENTDRKSLNMFDEAEMIAEILDSGAFSQLELSEHLGIAPSTLSNKLRILRLTREERRKINLSSLSSRHARALIRIQEPEVRLEVLEKIIEENLNIEQSEALIEERLRGENKGHTQIDKTKGFIDERIIENSIGKITSFLKKTGINVEIEKTLEEREIKYVLRIPRRVRNTAQTN